jgi:pantetheine-phosphate adenylyltransferase
MRRAACPGSFDPVTLGHLDIIGRASALYDEVVVAVGLNASKNRMFSFEERTEMLREVTAGYGNVTVDSFDGLIVDFCKSRDIPVIVKGLRAVSDFDYELQMAQMNLGLQAIETMIMTTNPLYSFL